MGTGVASGYQIDFVLREVGSYGGHVSWGGRLGDGSLRSRGQGEGWNAGRGDQGADSESEKRGSGINGCWRGVSWRLVRVSGSSSSTLIP